MSALDLLSFVNQVLFIGLFFAVAWRAARQPSPSNVNTALLFGGVAGALVLARITDVVGVESPWLTGLLVTLLNVCPWAMLRLVDDFYGSPRWVQIAGTVAFAAIAVFAIAAFESQTVAVEIATIAWFLLVGGYAAVAFTRASRRSRGLTRWRMSAVATGVYLFVAAVIVVFVGGVATFLGDVGAQIGEVTGPLSQVLALVAVLAFFAGFAPPAWLRRAWREPDLRSFLERSVHLSGIAGDREVAAELQRAAADTLGAPGASLGLASADGTTMRYVGRDGAFQEHPADRFVGGQAFVNQQRLITTDASAADPANAEVYESVRARAVIAVPVTAVGRQLGVLVIYGDRAPIFVEDDLWLAQLLADQIAVILEARRIAREASELRGREETTMLKEEFLSAAAHDLRTPLTVLLGQAELLERRVQRDPTVPIDPSGIVRIAREARRLRDLVTGLLDAQRPEDVRPDPDVDPVDLRELVEAACERYAYQGANFEITLANEPIPVRVDTPRLEQVLDNLLENARKYAPGAPTIEVRAWREGEEARVAVVDHGMGIPEAERQMVFDRFFRASNAQARSDTGLGLGLYICRRIVEGHGGRIWVEGTPGGGSTFVVALPTEVPRETVDGSPSGEIRSEPAPQAGSDA
jgi:signal transduction histidine kinase